MNNEVIQAYVDYKNRGKINGIKGFARGCIMNVGKRRKLVNRGDSTYSQFEMIKPL